EGEDGEWSEKVLTTDNNGTSYQVSGLLPYTVYSFHVVGVNSRGPSLPSLASYYMVTLREVPDGKPVITSAYNVSSTSIQLAWRAPAKNTLHGEFLGYRLAYRARDGDTDSVEEIYIRDPSIEFYTIQDLEVFKEYIITLQVFNPEGLGPPVTTMVFTDEGEPTAPRNVSILDVTNTTVKLKWEEPEFPNGLIAGYHVYYYQVDKSDTQVKIFKSSEKVQIQEVDNLESNTEYKLWVKAFTSENDGEPSEHHFVKTDVGIPSAPKIANLTCYSDTVLFIQWLRPVYFSNSIDYYYIEYRNEKDWDFEVQEVASTNNRNDYMMLIPNLTSDAMYEIRIRAGTRSINNPQFVHLGNYSEARKVLVQHDCGRPMSFKDSIANFLERGEITSGMVAGMACAVFALVLVILAFVLWRKYFQAAYYYLDDAPPPTPPNGVGVAWDGGSAVIKAESEDGDPPEEKGPIPVPLFPKHVIALHADGDIGFSKEYEAVQSGNLSTKTTTDHSMHPDNKGKNRYHNIVAYDQTRVILKLPPGQKKSCDYINANFIDGFQKSRAYIGTQGPLPTTFDAYWRMIWEQKVVIIVMITNLIERGRRKCDQYWPNEGTETYGVLDVTFIKEDVTATYTIRTFKIKHAKLRRKKHVCTERIVYQYHYTSWPDHGVPEHPLPILSFVRKSSAANPSDAGPIVVHCSAGVGRTGTYIVLDAMLRQVKSRGEINVLGFLMHIRSQRNFLVQTEEQYIFLHDALLEAIEAGDTCISRAQLTRYLTALQSSLPLQTVMEGHQNYSNGIDAISGTMGHLLDHQYKMVTKFQPKDFHLSSAQKPCNQPKNRIQTLIPVETARVHLTPKPGVEGSDYINASWIQGFSSLREYITTQHPLESTVADFWQMIWDHNIQTVVVLSSVYESDYPQFWPRADLDIECEHFRARLMQEGPPDGLVNVPDEPVLISDIIAQSLQDDYELAVRLIHCPGWPHRGIPLANLIRLPGLVKELHNGVNNNGPIVVVDRFGGTESATFCCLSSLYDQLNFEDHVDIYQIAKLYHSKRPNVWSTVEDYMFLYRTIESFSSNSPTSTNAGTTSMTSSLFVPSANGTVYSPSESVQMIGFNGNGYVQNLCDAVSLNSITLPPPNLTPTPTFSKPFMNGGVQYVNICEVQPSRSATSSSLRSGSSDSSSVSSVNSVKTVTRVPPEGMECNLKSNEVVSIIMA
ncbi:hypothetical protein QYM36_007700, partial [Artemia franciscana]